MKLPTHLKISILLFGDIVALYVALSLALYLRYGDIFLVQFANAHFGPFTVIFPLWVIVFYVAGLYDLPRLRNNIDFLKTLFLALGINTFLTITLFYLIPFFGITPRTNLFLFLIIFAVIESWWRRTFNIRASFREGLVRVLLIGHDKHAEEFRNILSDSPQIGYTIVQSFDTERENLDISRLKSIAHSHSINLIVIPPQFIQDAHTARVLYEFLSLGIEVRTLVDFYEMVNRKIPVDIIRESWFIEHRIGERRFYDDLKRGIEIVFAGILGVLLFPLFVLIAFLVHISSPGPSIYSQTRVGQFNRDFVLYKFRTMRMDAEKDGAQWAKSSDSRATALGTFLRYTHLDELPQLWNIIRGDLSFVGPRPERPEFVARLREEISFYDTRTLVQPGVTGWAQINYRYGSSVDDAREKLEYELYYLKNLQEDMHQFQDH